MKGKVSVLAFATVALSSCSPKVEQPPQKQLSVRELFTQYRPTFLATMSVSNFLDEKRQPCATDKDVIERSNEILLKVFTDPKIDRVRVETVLLKGIPIRIVETLYHWFPGDPGVQSTAVTWYLFAPDCRITDGGWQQIN